MTNKLNVLIVEDDEKDSAALEAEIKANPDKLSLAGTSKCSEKAYEFILNHNPHAVILDLELQDGFGDGLVLLDKLRNTVLPRRPYVIVNTKNPSKTTLDAVKLKGADYTFYKWQSGYSPKTVINHLLLVMPAILGHVEEPPEPPTKADLQTSMREFLQVEFNKLGVSVKNVGYDYLIEAVILAADNVNQGWGKIIGERVGKSEGSVSHAMQYAINSTWDNADINDLITYYTAPLRKNRYVPSTTEFVFFYRQKLKNKFN